MNLEAIAEKLTKAKNERKPILPFTQQDDAFCLADGYAVQDNLLDQALGCGEKLFGFKMGLTSKAKQADVGVSEPISGFLLESMSLPNKVALQRTEFIHPRAEPEIAVILGNDLSGAKLSLEKVASSIAALCLAVEILDSRFIDFKFQLPDVVADNTSAARFILGKVDRKVYWKDLPTEGILVRKNGVILETGTPGAVLGNPLQAVADLAEAMTKKGSRLKKGQMILTGGATASVPLNVGDQLEFSWAYEKLEFNVI